MIGKIRDIQKALKGEAYLSALALALTLPDICGKIADNTIKENGKRYAKWFNEYILKDKFPPGYPENRKFGDEHFYKLRCAFLHEGSVLGIPDTSSFELRIIESEVTEQYGASSYSMTGHTDSSCSFRVKLDVVQICTAICFAAENFYNSYDDKSAFDDQNIIITKVNADNYFRDFENIRK